VVRAAARFLGAAAGLVAGVVGGFFLGVLLYEQLGPSGVQFGDEFAGVDWALRSSATLGFAGPVAGHLIVRRIQRPRVHGLVALGELAGFLLGLVVGGSAGFVLVLLGPFIGPEWVENLRITMFLVLTGLGAAIGFAAGSAVLRRRRAAEPFPDAR
jgi:hypothetical protein